MLARGFDAIGEDGVRDGVFGAWSVGLGGRAGYETGCHG